MKSERIAKTGNIKSNCLKKLSEEGTDSVIPDTSSALPKGYGYEKQPKCEQIPYVLNVNKYF